MVEKKIANVIAIYNIAFYEVVRYLYGIYE